VVFNPFWFLGSVEILYKGINRGLPLYLL